MTTYVEQIRRRIELQGFSGLTDQRLAEIDPWLRLAPAICMVWVAAGTALGSAAVLWTLVPFAFLGAVLRGHPFDIIYNHWARHLLDEPRLPSHGAPRRFACGVAAVWLALTGVAFFLGSDAIGYALGATIVVLAGVTVTTGYCLPSALYQCVFRGRVTILRTKTYSHAAIEALRTIRTIEKRASGAL